MLQSVKKLVFDRLLRLIKPSRQATRTRRRTGSTVECELRSKPKSLAEQVFYPTSVKNQRFLPPSPQGEGFTQRYSVISLLAIGGFFDTLTLRVVNDPE